MDKGVINNMILTDDKQDRFSTNHVQTVVSEHKSVPSSNILELNAISFVMSRSNDYMSSHQKSSNDIMSKISEKTDDDSGLPSHMRNRSIVS